MIQKPRGTQDIYLDQAKKWVTLENKLRDILNKYNYSEIRTPIFELKELFVRSVGQTSDIVSKEMYQFTDKKQREFVLKPEGTAPTVRALIENKLYTADNLPFKTYYLSPMFRYERPQIGRNRQFHQLGIEVFGSDDLQQDIEVLTIAYDIICQLKLQDKVDVVVNYLLTGLERQKYILELKKYLQQFDLCDDCQTRFEKNTLRILDCKIDATKFDDLISMRDFLNSEQLQRYQKTLKILNDLNIKTVQDDKLVRGLDYYTGFVFEIKYKDNSLGSQQTLIAGGRYNNLVSEIGNIKLAACGFGMGLERVLLILDQNKIAIDNKDNSLDLYTICLSDNAILINQQILSISRACNWKCDTNNMHKSLKSAFKQAEKYNAKNIIILGDQEAQTNNFIIKNQQTKQQQECNLENYTEKINLLLKGV
ncbi:histidine--tRNA ligase [Mycoplasma putrefaciens]|uniref:Histidine--tRNA ligase n=1 Tax=Mycoplasma putrefaciens (strain ATCC 15718 / NCTC 10155 / C30 KS-1 / KS-1) TaxID=743965 RepID=A0A7U3ZSP8_MYCPK|nr:histidine--tRNA ligase [Mycoplasma putrefaciens]AEM68806.1 Histidyl-tRNA synthetase [Mycoplasma putrefaciens KS1]